MLVLEWDHMLWQSWEEIKCRLNPRIHCSCIRLIIQAMYLWQIPSIVKISTIWRDQWWLPYLQSTRRLSLMVLMKNRMLIRLYCLTRNDVMIWYCHGYSILCTKVLETMSFFAKQLVRCEKSWRKGVDSPTRLGYSRKKRMFVVCLKVIWT